MSDNDHQASEQDIPVRVEQYNTDFHFVNRQTEISEKILDKLKK
jgi:hypothetical protein